MSIVALPFRISCCIFWRISKDYGSMFWSCFLKHGGFSLLPKSVVVNCLKGNQQDSPQHNKHGSKTYYQYGSTTKKPKCFKEQRNAGISIPEFVDGFPMQEGGNFFPNHVQLLKSKGSCGASVQDSTLVHNPPESSESDTENKKPAGLKIVDMDVDDSFIDELQAHANTCKGVMHRV
jgi:hypothetical protein